MTVPLRGLVTDGIRLSTPLPRTISVEIFRFNYPPRQKQKKMHHSTCFWIPKRKKTVFSSKNRKKINRLLRPLLKGTRRVRYYKGYMTDPFNVTSLLAKNITHKYLKNNFIVHKTDRFCVCLTVVRFFAPHSWWGGVSFSLSQNTRRMSTDRSDLEMHMPEKNQTFVHSKFVFD